jgi:hypothetical protein
MVIDFWRIQNVVVKWFTLLFHIQDASRLKSVWRLANVIVFSLFSSVPPGKYQNGNLKSVHKCFLPNPFPIHYSLIMKIYQVVTKLLVGGDTQRQTGNLISLLSFLESRLQMINTVATHYYEVHLISV